MNGGDWREKVRGRGKGRASFSCAISVLNAAALGVGAAIAISAKVTVTAIPMDSGISVEHVGVDPGDDRLVEATADVVGRIAGWRGGWRLTIESEIPPRRGLKTSSATANGLVAAMLTALGMEPSWEEVLSLGVEAARAAGVTVTGAVDDAAASLLGGFAMADTSTGEVLLHRQVVGEGVSVLVGIGGRELGKGGISRGSFRPLSPAAEVVRDLAVEGRYWEAMTLNGIMVSAALGVDDGPAISSLRAGALGAGITGMGPAIAAVAPERSAASVAQALESHGLLAKGYAVENRPGDWHAEV